MTSGVEERVIRRLRSAGGIEVRHGGQADLLLAVKGVEIPLLLEVTHRLDDSDLEQLEGLPDQVRDRTVLVVPELSPKRRQEFRHRNFSWIEYRTGVVHLRVPHLAIDLPEDPEAILATRKSVPSLYGKAGIVVEALIELAQRHEFVAQPEVADLAGSTQAWTSKVFGALVEADALEVVGSGPSKQWRPRAEALLHLWEADGGPTPTVTPMYLWSRTSEDLVRSMIRFADATDAWAVGGMAAANLHEPTLSSVPAVDVWIPAAVPPGKVATSLDAQLIESGANVFLWQASGDPALRLSGPLRRWREDAPDDLAPLSVVTPARAAVEALHGTGRSPDVGEALRRRMLSEAPDSDV